MDQKNIIDAINQAVKEFSLIIKHYISVRHKRDFTGLVINSIVIFMVLVSITLLGILKIVNGNIIGTLLASVIGYTIGRSTQGRRGKDNETGES